jgi:hypothetical protein
MTATNPSSFIASFSIRDLPYGLAALFDRKPCTIGEVW